MRMCLNRNVLIGLGTVAVAVLVFAPSLFGAALPLLALAACPLSMIFMMRAMSGSGQACSTRSPASTAGESETTESPRVAEPGIGNGRPSLTPEEIQAELRALEARQQMLQEHLDALQRHPTGQPSRQEPAQP